MRSALSKYIFLFFFLLSGMAGSVYAVNHVQPLAIDKAFAFNMVVTGPKSVQAEWRIAPGYYLYTHKLHISLPPNAAATMQIPAGEVRQDIDRGRYEVYAGTIKIPIQLQTPLQTIQLKVEYQGCSQAGFCYPPVQKMVSLDLSSTTWRTLLIDQNGVSDLFAMQHTGVMLLIFIGIGILLSFTPCVLPMIPILTGIIVGQKKTASTFKAFLLSLSYVLGTSITYALAGVAAALMGGSLQAWLQQPWIIIAISSLFVLLAISLFGFYDLQMPRRWSNRLTHLSNRQQGGNYVGVFLMGILSALIVSPCVTAPLVGVLIYIGQTGDMVLGASALFAMGIGMGIPLILIGVTAGKWLPKRGPWMEAVKKIFGVLMLGMAVWMLSRIYSLSFAVVFSGIILLALALLINQYLPHLTGRKKLNQSLGCAVGVVGLFLILSGISMPHVLRAWLGWESQHATVATQNFIVVNSVAELNKQLALARAANKPVLLDFYAEWCESCVIMDKKVFGVPDVQRILSNYVLLRADLTSNNVDDEALLKTFNIVAPPTVLFFNKLGEEKNDQRIVGEINANEFITKMKTDVRDNCSKNIKC